MGKSVVKDWVSELTFKQQSVLFCALRGCDTVDKYDITKKIIRKLRGVVLNDACPSGSEFMQDDVTTEDIYKFTKELDKYPVHFLLHLIHAGEVVGYCHPGVAVSTWWTVFYITCCQAFHMNPETKEQHLKRLEDGVETICHKT